MEVVAAAVLVAAVVAAAVLVAAVVAATVAATVKAAQVMEDGVTALDGVGTTVLGGGLRLGCLKGLSGNQEKCR